MPEKECLGRALYFACCAMRSSAPMVRINFPECVNLPTHAPSAIRFSLATCRQIEGSRGRQQGQMAFVGFGASCPGKWVE